MRKADIGFVTDRIYTAVLSDLSLSLVEEMELPPLRKEYYAEITEDQVASALTTVAAIEDGRLLGFAVVVNEEWNRRANITDFFVDHQARRRGLGREMMNRISTDIKDKGQRCLWVETQNVNFPAIKFYQSLGFAFCGFDKTLYDVEFSREVAVFMSKPIESA